MTDEYREFLKSRESDHQETPRWKPPKAEDPKPVEHSDIPHWKPTVRAEESKPSEFLAHHGIPGMKWGVRRYQNYDGTRIGADSEKKGEPKFNSKTLQYKKKAQHLTDEELDRRNNRMQKEVKYDQLRKTLQPKTKAQRRKEIRHKILVTSAVTAAAAVMTQVYTNLFKKAMSKASGGKINFSGK